MPRPMLLILLAVSALGGCSREEEGVPGAALQASNGVAGLYERAGRTGAPDRLCLARRGGGLRFGLATGSVGPGNCTARGTAVREGAALQLRIDGAPACNLSATATSTGVTLGRPQGAECEYYCGAGAVLTPGTFAKSGASAEDIGEAVDAAGEPLC